MDSEYMVACTIEEIRLRVRIASLEAERDRLREMVRKLIPWTGACPDYFSDKDDCGKCEHCITRREAENYIAASIGGEVKNGI